MKVLITVGIFPPDIGGPASFVPKIANILTENGYNLTHNKKKSFFSIGPFAEMSHAKEESKKLKNVFGLDSKISSFIF